ncbi:MAG: hypothetical protein AB4038_09025 [Prochloraceae cyanobacterium]
MFGKPPKPIQQPDLDQMPDIMVPPEPSPTVETIQQETEFVSESNLEKSELMNKVETVSTIVSPYFIVVVGLLLYDKNFLLSLILLATGILALLKVSFKDIMNLVDNIKKFF